MKQLFLLTFPFMLWAQVYQITGPNKNVAQNVVAKILTKAYAQANLEMKAVFLPPQEALDASCSGKLDGELARIKKISKFCPDLRIIPVSLVNIEAVAYSKDKNIHIKQWADLKNYNFTITKGSKFIEEATKNFKKESVSTFPEAFEKLMKNKTQIIVIPKKSALHLMIEKKYYEIKPVSPVLKKLKLYHFLHKKNAKLIPILTPILQKMKDSGEISYINTSYLRSLVK
ncbi:transporter substrate-binding domain-containing protein [Sulfurimonas sp. MAG313]|nr:transporter substrate-binding domain-containing protein [Sulfurimonas sp. MAG313]MDF1880000.1 transporter substrate-binding domain-containing protein [Sulfurimonas sp. MAG313]